MPDFLTPLLLASTLVLLIPGAVVLGHRRPQGAIVVTAGASIAASAVFWLVLCGPNLFFFGGSSENAILRLVLFFGDLLLWIAGWALALNAAAQARVWRWVALLTVCGPLSCLAFLVSIAPPTPCFFGQPQPQGFEGGFACSAPNPALQVLVIVLYVAAPAATLAFALRDRLPHLGMVRSGPAVAALATSPTESGADDADGELDMRTERL